jgi:PAS domain S-box-containing protein
LNPFARFGADGDSGFQVLWEDGDRVFCREWRRGTDGNRDTVLTVLPAADQPTPANLDRLARGYALKDELEDAWAVRPLALVRENGRTMLVLQDPGGEPLARQLGVPMEVERFLQLAIGIAGALGKLHRAGLVHKDLKPGKILVDCPDGQVRLTGFGLASRLSRERQAPDPPEFIAGTLAYMAPEQTGRMNRSIDPRSDLYSLGIVFYQMLTGSLPFTATDPIEWVHDHVARRPVPPAERVPCVPAVLSAIIMRLLAKAAEDRYQTAAGLESDLRRCLAAWQAERRIDDFQLGEHDTPDRLFIPEKLYGREREIATLLAAFDRVVNGGAPELVLVSGYSGIGKSSVVNELHKVLVPPRGLFASGKFDQYKRDIPFSTLAQAFQSLVRTLLSKSDTELSGWRDALLEALGPNGRLIADIVPELKLIVGEQPPVPELPPQDTQRRFQLVFRRFIGVFARPEHPLALFLDDLQWLDAATLDLLEDLLTRPDLQHLILIGAYRDNEVDAAHPLMRKLDAIKSAGGKIAEITLAPLARAHLNQLIADALRCELERVAPLAQLLHEKTAGNPFFAIQFISSLAEEGMLTFDYDAGRWSWDLERIHAKGYTDNVVDLMVGKLARLPAETQEALQLLACLGNVAGIARLSIALGTPEERVDASLWPAVRQEMVERLEGSYKFMHDRMQEASYSLIPEALRPEVHLRIGRLLAARATPGEREEAIFDIVNQLNRGTPLITDLSEKEKLKQLNALAGRRAKNAIAYASARSFLTQATALLGPDAWTAQYEDTFALLMERCECEYMTGNFQVAEELSAAILENAGSDVDRANVHRLRLRVSESGGRYHDALFVMRDALRLFGMTLPESDEAIDAATKAEAREIAINLRGRRVADLADAPTATDPNAEMIISLIAESLSHDHVTAQWLPFLAATGVNICLRYGNACESSVVYNGYARVLVCAGDFQSAFEFSEMALHLAGRFDNRRLETLVVERHAFFVNHWRHHVSTSLQYLDQCFDAYVKLGDFHAGYAGFHLVEISIERGCPLDELLRTCGKYADFAAQSYNDALLDTLRVQKQFIACLTGRTREPTNLDDGGFRAERLAALAVRRYHVLKQQLLFLFGRYGEALASAERATPALRWRDDLLLCATYHFYRALTLAALYLRAPPAQRQEFRQILGEELRRHRSWADNCPENFANRHALLAAEVARIDGQDLEAMRRYEQAIRSARDNGFVQNQALANELAGRFHLARGLETSGYAHLRNARSGYAEWGADGKVRQLEEMYPHLRTEKPMSGPTSTIAAPLEQLDLATVLKVSQAVSSEIVLEKLIDTLMRTAIEQAGAERGLLILSRGPEHRLAAETTIAGDTVTVQKRDEAVTAAALPELVLHYVLRAQETVVLDDAAVRSPFSPDPYIQQHQARSILCLPLITQAKPIGVLYLENNLAPGVFASGRIAVLKLLASQAAIALENASLYRDLAEREAKIRRLVDANIIGIFIWNSDGHIIEANDAFLRMLGYDSEDLVAGRLRWTDMTPEDWHASHVRALQQRKTTGVVHPYEKEFFHKDGNRVPVLIGAANFDDSGNRGVGFVLDLTQAKRAEEALRESEERFRTLVQFSFDVYWESDAEHRFIRQQFAEGLADAPAPGSEIGKTRWEVPYLEPDEEVWRKHRETLDAHLPFRDFELARPMPDGGKRYVSVSGLPVFDETGRFIGYRGVSRHITERKRAEEELRYHMQLLKTVTDTVSTAVYILDPTGLGTFVNPSLERITGYRAEELIGQVVHDKIHHTKPDGTPCPVHECPLAGGVRQRRVLHGEDLFVRKDGTFFPVRYTASPIFRDGVAVGTAIEVRDLTERKQAEQALHQARAELAHVARVMTMGELTASIAHEVNQPLAALATNANACLRWLARQPPNLDEARECLHRMIRDVHRAGEVITRIRSLAKKSSPVKARLDLNDAIYEVLAMIDPEARRYTVLVRTDLAASLPPVQADRVQLQQVILNLVMNGIEATKEVADRPRELRIWSHPNEGGAVLVSVQDNGIGLEAENLERVFEAFYTTKAAGMGIGLSISRSIIEAHGGRLWVNSNVPHGSIFHFTVPAHPGSAS